MYQIKEFEIENFVGMHLNNVSRFKMSELSDYNVILGRNGCGKSRLMGFLPPVAPNKTDLLEGGKWTQHIVHDHVNYRLTCENQKGHLKNSIVNLDTKETILDRVNPSVYNAYINEHFKFNRDIHDIITGKVLLTDMKTNDRRYWFSLLSESDLDFALKFYKEAKKRVRDLQGAINDTNEQISDLMPKVLQDESERTVLQERIQVLQKDIGILDTALAKNEYRSDVTLNSLDAIDQRIGLINDTVATMETHIPKDAITDRAGLLEARTYLKATLDHQLKQLEELTRQIDDANKIRRVDVQALAAERDGYLKEVATLESSLVMFSDLIDYDLGVLKQAKGYQNQIINTISDCFTALDSQYPTDNLSGRLQALHEQYDQLSKSCNVKRNQISLREERLHHIGHVNDINCPACHHTFKPGVDADESDRLHQDLLKWRSGLESDETKLKEIEELIRIYTGFVNQMRAYVDMEQLLGQGGPWSKLFDHYRQVNVFANRPKTHLAVIQQFIHDLDAVISIHSLKSLTERLNTDIAIANAASGVNPEELYQIRNRLESEIQSTQTRIRSNQTSIDLLDQIDQRLAKLSNMEESLMQLVQERSKVSTVLIENIRVEVMTEHRKELWDLLMVANQRFENMVQEQRQLEYLQKHRELLERKFKVSQQIVKAMSPDTGLLAKHLYQCISKITEFMTAYINRVWSYEIKIMPCDIQDGELDYKFPFWSNDCANVIADISMGSKGQREVINFVFILAVYNALGLNGYPLFLDELGSAFDEEHRPALVGLIKDLVAQGKISSVFMVSHDAGTHLQLTNANVVVLDPNGVTLPKEFNKHVIIE